jgi:peptidyl-prolyl cis-trans isomerase A (cyclophilin A)
MGTFKVQLMPDHAPVTVKVFTDLATGAREWRDPRDGKQKSEPLYDGTVFHRVIPDFMIQAGEPEGSGRGGPGYTFQDETPQGGPTFERPDPMCTRGVWWSSGGGCLRRVARSFPSLWSSARHTAG